jgi:hypothetical protein
MYHENHGNLNVDLNANPPRFPTLLSPGLINFALGILEYTRAIKADTLNNNKRSVLRGMLKEIDTFRIEITISLPQEKSLAWLATAHALFDELEKAENRIVDYFRHHADREEELIADIFTRQLQELKKEQQQFNSVLMTNPNNAIERALIQVQYKNLKKNIKEFNAKCSQYEAEMSPAQYREIRREFYKLNENFKTDRIEWREQKFNRLTRIQDKAQLLFSDIGSGLADKWSQLRDLISGKDEQSLAKQLSCLERELVLSKRVLDGMGSMLEQTSTYRTGMKDYIEKLRSQLSELDTSFHLLRVRSTLRSQTASKNYEERLAEIGRKLEGMNRHVVLADLTSATAAITHATSRSQATKAIERATDLVSSLVSGVTNSPRSISTGDMQSALQAQTSFENAKRAAVQKFGLAAVNPRVTAPPVKSSRPDSMGQK